MTVYFYIYYLFEHSCSFVYIYIYHNPDFILFDYLVIEKGVRALQGVDVSDVTSGGNDDIIDSISNSDVATTDPQRDVVVVVVDTDVIPEGRVHADPLATEMTADVLMTNVGSGCPGQYRQGDLLTVDHTAGGDSADPPNAEQPHTDIAVLKPHTACFDVGNNRQLHDLTASIKYNTILYDGRRGEIPTVYINSIVRRSSSRRDIIYAIL